MLTNMNIQDEIASSHQQALSQAGELEPQIRALLELAGAVTAPQERLALLAKAQLLEWRVLSLQEELFAYRSELPAEPLACVALLDPLDNAQASLTYLLEGFAELRVKVLAPELPRREEWDSHYGRLGAPGASR